MPRVMQLIVFSVLFHITGLVFAQHAAQECPETSYRCVDPNGREIPGGTVGPVRMWYSPVESRCIPSPYSVSDACEYITRLCNERFPFQCRENCPSGQCPSDCLAGSGMSVGEELTCTHRTNIPFAPPTSNVHH